MNGADDRGEVRGFEAGLSERSGNGAAVSDVRKAKGKKVNLRKVQRMRGELAGRGRPDDQRESQPVQETHAGHQTYPYGEKRYCSECKVYF